MKNTAVAAAAGDGTFIALVEYEIVSFVICLFV